MTLSLIVVYTSAPCVITGALDWLEHNKSNPYAPLILIRLLKRNPTESKVRFLAADWLNTHDEHPEATSLREILNTSNQ